MARGIRVRNFTLKILLQFAIILVCEWLEKSNVQEAKWTSTSF